MPGNAKTPSRGAVIPITVSMLADCQLYDSLILLGDSGMWERAADAAVRSAGYGADLDAVAALGGGGAG